MRRFCLSLLAVSGLVSVAFAEFALPKHVARMSQLEKVKDLANSKKAGITFVYTDEGTT